MYELLLKVKVGMNYILASLCTLFLVVMTLLVLWQVFSRYVLGAPSAFTEELVRYFLIWTGFIGAAYAFSARAHMQLTIVRDQFSPENRKRINAVVDIIILLFALIFMVVGGARLTLAAQMEYSALLGISRALVYSMAPIAGVLIIVAQIINLYEDLTGRELTAATQVQPESDPVVADPGVAASVDAVHQPTEK